jgi:exodeoxyribonuclease VII large subunit
MISDKNHFTVSELNFRLKNILESSFGDVYVTGEISNFHNHSSSGHMYFTLKDDTGELRGAMFRGSNSQLNFKPSNGLEVKIFGSVTFYERKGQAQLVASKMELAGKGDFFKAYEELKKRLLEKGLFDSIHKKLLPQFPRSIGIVTAASGAAIKDILSVLKRRAPHAEVIIRSVSVQGKNSATEISQAILELNQYASVDVIIIGRGGGSIEDLWSFNDETLAETIFSSFIPIVSAVGHDTDFTISDLVSDVRAPTPSVAAEIVSSSTKDILLSVDNYKSLLTTLSNKLLEKVSIDLDYLDNRLLVQKPERKISRQLENLSKYREILVSIIKHKLKSFTDNEDSLNKQLLALGPQNVIKRGYSIVLNKSGNIVQSSKDLIIGEVFSLKMKDGSIKAKKIS